MKTKDEISAVNDEYQKIFSVLSDNSKARLAQQITVVGEKIEDVLALYQKRIHEEEEAARIVDSFQKLVAESQSLHREVETMALPSLGAEKPQIKIIVESLKVK